ncbi:TonB system transport protein ExbD [Ancylobacter novellus DSM 506]|uniref:Biopolymer transport protein ExbD n=1 Tax=Ancylobacter novellus (strain ATCC 8093 / DSM 506 / JCM 20403 / CCM 1077 / IAM 12100 / NBRC 12443 / NCIMB 10456) TaxID=639283 RepID=D7A5H9_ANCN5|nr:TonB system transport protein ExbD [Ancylobacter novellus]ADH88103.1 TonB system transport protein ExbD [Ancylobacter novellus DSM 506]
MAAKLQSGDSDDLVENHEINVTPFIDVILVLLIIFMVAAPLSTVDVAVDLPASNAQMQQRPDKPVYLTVKSDLGLALGNEDVVREMLGVTLDRATETKRDTRIFLRADKMVAYGELMEVMNLLRAAGYLKIALVGLEMAGQPAPAPGTASRATPPAATPGTAAPVVPAPAASPAPAPAP